jgi:hypothetical protein
MLSRNLGGPLEASDNASEVPDVAPSHRPSDGPVMTAHVSVQDGRLRIQRTGVGRWLGASVDVPLAHVVSAGAADRDDVSRWNKGIRLVGIQVPGLMTSGVYRQGGQLTWWDVRRGGNAIVITFRDERLARAVLEVDDPAAVLRLLEPDPLRSR